MWRPYLVQRFAVFVKTAMAFFEIVIDRVEG